MILSPGHRLGPYEILAAIGAGGMGEVYKARDTRLDRLVAIKTLPAELSADPLHLRRFEQEARAASALSHPGIVVVYDVGSVDGVSYYATELVDGKTLLELLVAGPLPIRRVLDIGAQLADALACAHESGILHRDLKPSNVMLSKGRFVKVLDFGLAKLFRREPAAPGDRETTITSPATQPGEILGSVGYMSPEQANGLPVDYRSDQFSLGAILYELATGQRAFRRSNRIDTLSAILHDEPESIARLRPEAPAPLRWVIERCLSKDRADRYGTTRDLARELRDLRDHLSEISMDRDALPAATRRSRSRFRLALVSLAAGAVAVLVWLGWARGRGAPTEPDFRRLTFRQGAVGRALFLPGTKSILYTAAWEGRPPLSFQALADAPGLDRELESGPQVPMAASGDGSQILVVQGNSRAQVNLKGTLAWWPALGGKARPVLEDAGWADWAEKGRFFAVVRDAGIERTLEVRTEAGPLRTLFRTRGAISWVRLSPDEKRVAFIHHPSRFDDAGEVRIVSTDGSGSMALTPVFERCLGLDWNARSGEIWFTASRATSYTSALWAVSPSRKLRGLSFLPEMFVLQSVSRSGEDCLLILSENRISMMLKRSDGSVRDFSWLGYTMVADLSPDGRSVLFFDGGATEKTAGAWIRPLEGGDAVPLGAGEPWHFSPDGHWFVSSTRARAGPPQIDLVPVGAGSRRSLTAPPADFSEPSFAGSDAILCVRSYAGKQEIWRLETSGGKGRSLGVEGCGQPMASPSLREFLCLGGKERDALLVFPISGGTGRRLYDLSGRTQLRSARWDETGDRIFAVTAERRLLTLDVRSGALLHEETLALPDVGVYGVFYRAALSADGRTQAYSVARSSSGLYLCGGIR